MFNFEEQKLLYFLFLVPILVILFVLMWQVRNKNLEKFGERALVQQLMAGVSRYKNWLKFALLMLSLIALTIGLANPRWGIKRSEHKKVEIYIALDISESMLAEDIRPNRIQRARQFAKKLLKKLPNERVGLIIFAGNAFLQVPLTTDFLAIEKMIEGANTNMAPIQGTAIAEAIKIGANKFSEGNEQSKAIILITDGENHEQEAINEAVAAYESGVKIYTIGSGTPEGAFIPTIVRGNLQYKKDKTNNLVRSRLNEDLLYRIAENGGGNYYNLQSKDEEIIEVITESISTIDRMAFDTRGYEEYESYFQIFVGIALLLMLIEFLISYRKSKWLGGRDLFGS